MVRIGHVDKCFHWRTDMDSQHIELARQAAALLRDALAGEGLSSLVMDGNSAEYRATHGLAVVLLGQCVEPADLEQELACI
jgi:hypothetical protein